ncbi:MAG: sulfur carrier protein ThiS [Spirochaetales bacterium]|nr:sulfur carrier protein ThiS [Spirochaetales bacterium]
MIKVNGKLLEWRPNITFADIYRQIGYTLKNPRVIVRINGEAVAKTERSGFIIPDESDIEVINTLCGG